MKNDKLYSKYKKILSKAVIDDIAYAVNIWIKREMIDNKVVSINNFGRFNIVRIKCVIDGKKTFRTRLSFRPDPSLQQIPKLETKLR